VPLHSLDVRKIKIHSVLFNLIVPLFLCGYAQPQSLPSPPTEPLYFAVSAMTSPARTLVHFSELERYLSAKLQRPVLMKQRRTYKEINELLAQSTIQMAFTCTGGYIEGRRKFGLELLAVPIINGKSYYRSYIVVRKAIKATSLGDLQGQVFAYADPLSLTGYLYPAAKIRQMGYPGCQITNFFKQTFFTESHDKSIEAVATGFADGAAVDSLIFDALLAAADPAAVKLKIIERSDKFGMPPVVVPPNLDPAIRFSLLKVLLNMAKDPEGRAVLQKLGMDGFILPDPALYRSALILDQSLNE
jgi:phosphonate transport system substrate-binding protein